MRATSLPPALPIGAAAMPLLAAVMLLLAVPSTASAERWLRPVPGEVARSFSYARATPFAGGAHRGADLAARPGTPVRSACAGTVAHAGPVAAQGRVVTVRCGPRRVTYLPLARVSVRAGAAIPAGAEIGTVAGGHGGLHLGVRRAADRYAYEDPLALIASPANPHGPPIAARRPPRPIALRRPAMPRHPGPRPAAPPRPVAPAPLPAPHVALPPPSLVAPPRPGPGSIAPWPVWAGLALLLAGAAGAGSVALSRRRAWPRPHALAGARREQETRT